MVSFTLFLMEDIFLLLLSVYSSHHRLLFTLSRSVFDVFHCLFCFCLFGLFFHFHLVHCYVIFGLFFFFPHFYLIHCSVLFGLFFPHFHLIHCSVLFLLMKDVSEITATKMAGQAHAQTNVLFCLVWLLFFFFIWFIADCWLY